jgi:hypothetical protein
MPELCEFCNSNGAVLPSLEAFEMRLEIPMVYIIFYDYFFKASVGDSRWKRECLDEGCDSLGSIQAESFAMLQLKNNYFAWLLEAKKAVPTLLTDYCPEPRRRGKRSGAQAWLGSVEVNINGAPGEPFLVHEGHEKYNDLVKLTEQGVKRAATKARQNKTYKELTRTLEEIGEDSIDAIDDEDAESLSPEKIKLARMWKKRRILKPLRAYTVRKEEEGKFKGWSRRAAADMASLNSTLKEQSVDLAKFRSAYKEVYRMRCKVQGRDAREELTPINYSELWDLEPQTNIVI